MRIIRRGLALPLVLAGCAATPAPRAARASVQASPAPADGELPVAPVAGECPPEQGEACFTSADGFRFIHPRPASNRLRDVHVMPDGEVWIVGDDATLLRIVNRPNGERRLSRIAVPGAPSFADVIRDTGGEEEVALWPGVEHMLLDFDAIVASAGDDVWIAVGERQVLRWDGAAWRSFAFDPPSGGTALLLEPGEGLWAAGSLAASLFDDQAPALLRLDALDDGFALGPSIDSKERIHALARQGDEVWAAGAEHTLFRSRGGARFEPVPVDGSGDFMALWLDPQGSAGFLATHERLFRKEGASFVLDAYTASSARFHDLVGFAGGEAWLVGDGAWRRAGGVLREVDIEDYQPLVRATHFGGERIEAVHGRRADDVWMVGASGLVLHWDGKALREPWPRLTEESFVGLAWSSADEWLAVARDGTVVTGTLAGALGASAAPAQRVTGVGRTRAGDVVLAGCEEAFVRAGDGWRPLPRIDGCITRVAGHSADDLWAIGTKDWAEGKLWHLSQGSWGEIATGFDAELLDIQIAPGGGVWIAGRHAIFRTSAGDKLERVASHEYDVYRGIAIRADDDVWIAGDSGDIGSAGLLLHWNGSALTRHESLTANYLASVAITASGEVYAVGLGGVAVRHDGKAFRPLATGCSESLDHLVAHPSGALVAAGAFGTLMLRAP